jgi:hypothetical protein
MVALLAQHQLLIRIVGTAAAVAFVLVVLVAATGDRERHGRHGRGVRRGTRAEVRRHRRRGPRTWPGTISARLARHATSHVLDETSADALHSWSLRFEHTVDITAYDLEAILGPRPIGASA